MIRAVVFDCFGVLTTDTWKLFVASQPPNVNVSGLRDLNHQLDAGLIDTETFLKEVYDLTGSQPIQVEKLLNNEIAKNTQLLDYIKELRKANFKIGMLSNISTNWIRDDFLNPEEQALFDEMVFSYEVGMTKPDPRIFSIVCERLGKDPSEVVMIDDVLSYCAGAESIGMSAIQYIDYAQCKAELDILINHE